MWSIAAAQTTEETASNFSPTGAPSITSEGRPFRPLASFLHLTNPVIDNPLEIRFLGRTEDE